MQRKPMLKDIPWQDDAFVAYKEYLTYAGEEVSQGIQHNLRVKKFLSVFYGTNTLFSSEEARAPQSEQKAEDEQLEVSAKNGEFYPLFAFLDARFYCNKLVIRNVQNANFIFEFTDYINFGDIEINMADKKASNEILIAYRRIVPSQFSQAPSLAGPMGCHEYLIDGSNCTDTAGINFRANLDAPLKIVLENCKGSCFVPSFDPKISAEKFANMCDKEAFELKFSQMRKPSLR